MPWGEFYTTWFSFWQGTKVSRRRKRATGGSCEPLEPRQLLVANGWEVDVPDEISTAVPLIVNGVPTSNFEAVGLVGDTDDDFCSGTLIAPDWVLTAGHCGEGVADDEGRFTINGVTYTTDAIYLHPDYNPRKLGKKKANDLSLWHLSTPVEGVTPMEINRSAPHVGQSLILVGYGAGGDDRGHFGDFGHKRVGTTPLDKLKPTLLRWKFDVPGESNTAPGDSGGPALIERLGVYYIAGVTSGGSKRNASMGDHSFDTRVDAYQNWIDDTLSGVFLAAPGTHSQGHGSNKTQHVSSKNVTRIINGTTTSDFPAVGKVGNKQFFHSSGTLIDPYWVLTAGHSAADTGNRKGRFELDGVVYKTSRIYVNPAYSRSSLGKESANDIALLRLRKPVTGVTPVPLLASAPVPGETLTLVGYGYGGTSEQITTGYGTLRTGTTPLEEVTAHLLRWNFDDPGESSVAPGDSGGPALIDRDGVFYVAGVTSGAVSAPFTLGAELFDTRVDAYLAWIEETQFQNPAPGA